MVVQQVLVKRQDKEVKKEGEVSSFVHIAKEVVTLWRSAIRYMAIQVQASEVVDQGHIGVPTMLG